MSASERNEHSLSVDNGSDEDDAEPETEVAPSASMMMRLPPATITNAINPAHPGLPLAVTILSSPDALLKVQDASTLVPPMFAQYKGQGGENVRAMYHSMLTEYKTNVDNAYTMHGKVKSAIFVAFVELCCAFTSEPTEKVCAIIVETTTEFMDRIRTLLKSPILTDLKEFQSAARDSISIQLDVAQRIFPQTFNTGLFQDDFLDFLGVADGLRVHEHQPTGKAGPTSMFMFMHAFAKYRETAFYTYAKFVQAQVATAVKEQNIYIGHLFIHYFIYTLLAVCRLSVFDFAKMREAFKESDDKVNAFYKYKINSQMHSNFGDLCSCMLAKPLGVEMNLRAEYKRYLAATAPVARPEPAQAQPPVERYRPEMVMPVEDAAQQGGGCAIL